MQHVAVCCDVKILQCSYQCPPGRRPVYPVCECGRVSVSQTLSQQLFLKNSMLLKSAEDLRSSLFLFLPQDKVWLASGNSKLLKAWQVSSLSCPTYQTREVRPSLTRNLRPQYLEWPASLSIQWGMLLVFWSGPKNPSHSEIPGAMVYPVTFTSSPLYLSSCS